MRTLLQKEFRELVRTRKVLVVGAILLVFGLLGPLTVKYMPLILSDLPGVPEGLADVMPEPDITMAVDEYVQNLSQFGVILAILVPMAAIVGEKSSGTAAMILSKPVSRAAFLGAKWIMYAIVFIGGVFLAALGGYYYIGVLFDWLGPLHFLALNALVALYLMMYLSITLFASTICRSQLAAAGLSFGSLILFGLVGAIPSISDYLPASVMKWGRSIALGQGGETAWQAVVIASLIILATWFASWLSFRKQEL
jgi:ABC-2 type transport system permease protein